ncbi:hypothetical protein GCM10022280_24750 [Sphingomonas swuensis]|uniref:Lipoprotein n=1 Tax=Sphingomonas swuensis TaxID=977800 RepID=A0ABP7T9W7_9SPHN
MRMVAIGAVLVALAGCGDRRTFDERYDDTSKQLEEKARQLDQNLSQNVDEAPKKR